MGGHCEVPQYESLTVEKIYAFLKKYNVFDQYLHIKNKRAHLPKQWVCNVAAVMPRWPSSGAEARENLSEEAHEHNHNNATRYLF